MVLPADQIIRSKRDAGKVLVHHLTADNSWLIQIPRFTGPRPFFNVLLDPWLAGNQVQFFAWFHDQGHTEDSAFQTMADVERFIEDIETLALKYRDGIEPIPSTPDSFVDAVALSLQGTDHCHQATLTQLPAGVPIFSNHGGALKLVRSWNHFETIVKSPKFTGDWRDTVQYPLPKEIGISAIQSPYDYSDLHAGIVIAFRTAQSDETKDFEDEDEAECILYTPHGILPSDVSALVQSSPRVDVLAQLHGCLRVDVGFRFANFAANMGAHNGLAVSRALHSKYWLHTHDERKVEKGLTSWILTHDWQTVDNAASEFAQRTGESKEEVLKRANYHDIGNGGSLVLV